VLAGLAKKQNQRENKFHFQVKIYNQIKKSLYRFFEFEIRENFTFYPFLFYIRNSKRLNGFFYNLIKKKKLFSFQLFFILFFE
jgi:hypothetical protein